MADKDCLDAVKALVGDKLPGDEVRDAIDTVKGYRESGKPAAELRRRVIDDVEERRIKAALKRKQAAENVIARKDINADIASFKNQGMSPWKAIAALFESTGWKNAGVEGGRKSDHNRMLSYLDRYHSAWKEPVQRERPYIFKLLDNKKFDEDVDTELGEIKPGGKPGVTGNDDARWFANVLATTEEMSRQDGNSHGASIGKLEGRAGPQVHDDTKMLEDGDAAKDNWIDYILPLLDKVRTFGEGRTTEQMREVLSSIYDTIITGIPRAPTAGEKGQRTSPGNKADALAKHRYLHFASREAARTYRDKYGYGNTISGIFAHLNKMARVNAIMDRWGSNPEVMFTSVVEEQRRLIGDSDMAPDAKTKALANLNSKTGPLRQAFDIATGLGSTPENVTAANIGKGIRVVEGMGHLGMSLFSSVSDLPTGAVASMFRGSGLVHGFKSQLEGLFMGRPKGERGEIAAALNAVADGVVSSLHSVAWAEEGTPVGLIGKLQDLFFRMNGLTYWTDANRRGAKIGIAWEMAHRASSSFDELDATNFGQRYKHVLKMHGIDAPRWEAIRQAGTRLADGKNYITPELMRNLSDEAVAPIIADRLAAAKPERHAALLDKARFDLEMQVRSFIADETRYAVVETDARSQRTTTWGSRPGTLFGESMRLLMQFKGYPTAFVQRVWGRALFGHRKGADLMEKGAHIGALLAGMTMAGYVSATMKDLARGYWPPRTLDITNPQEAIKTLGAAFMQGGAAGVYGDFLFASANRFGGGLFETMGGPTYSTASNAWSIFSAARSSLTGKLTGDKAKMPAGDALNLVFDNTPFINLFYVRPVLDVLFLNSMKEALSPGYLKRQNTRRRNDYGQTPWHAQRTF